MSGRPLRIALGLALAALVALFVVRAAAKISAPPRLESAPLLALGSVVYGAAYLFRALRLELLLPPEDRPRFLDAWSISGATTFLLQVLPFRGGEPATLAAFRELLGTSWARAGAVFVLVKGVDSASALLVGLAGAALLALSAGRIAVGSAAATLVLLGSVLLLLVPWLAGGLLTRLARWLPAGSRRARAADEMRAGLLVARDRPLRYLAAVGCGLGFFVGHLAGVAAMCAAFGKSVPLAALAFASLASNFMASAVPSPVGTFGPMESGFAAGLATVGIPLAEGALLAAVLHVVTILVCGVLGLPWLLRALAKKS